MKEDYQPLIDNYLLNRLSPEDRLAFERRMKEDPDFAAQVDLQRRAMDLIEAKGDAHLREQVGKVHQQMVSAPKKDRFARRRLLSLAAAAAAAVLIGILAYWWLSGPTDHRDLFARNFQNYPLTFGDRTPEGDNTLREAEIYYRGEDYVNAIPLFEQALAADPNPKVRLALGIALLGNGQAREAQAHFDTLIANNDPLYSEQASWYLALTHLQRGDLDACKNSLQKINSKSRFYPSSLRLLEELGKI